ncbi:Alpha/beta-Hydrolases superfamily protein [Tripterygium wilfordii]|uniref:Alpha/beta-Hydrolases superfamily protein n=1 Tax=Tripterygium wilfordii TaxID=458696 RepID=A0A7J7CVI4_TRIWF|nr:transmembrane protein 53-like [Tripterygium wilfordii]KAF5737949.1 Alpha/beta-Hydrolases superfamily protein [Tripterygium wilfordii]
MYNMGSLSGILQRQFTAAALVATVSVSTDFSNKWPFIRSSDTCSTSEQIDSSVSLAQELKSSWVSHISVSKLVNLSYITQIQIPVPNVHMPVPNLGTKFVPGTCGSFASPVLLYSYQSAKLPQAAKPTVSTKAISSSPPDVLYRWHLPEPYAIDVSGTSNCSSVKSKTVVVLLGWLGAKQKHLKRYAEWYTSMGFHAITFTFPMSELVSYQVGGKAEQNVEMLVDHLAGWLEEHGKNLVFHTFSNTGWLTYGVILEKFQKQDHSLTAKIRGCIVDSAPVARPDPQVWASGFSAAFLKKNSVATKGFRNSMTSDTEEVVGGHKPAVTESALLLVLEKFFEVVLNLPKVNRRLTDVVALLSSGQPKCPQLYIYSSADRVIPAESVESFIDEQRKAGREVRACNFVSTRHVDHFRNDPNLYTAQLNQFLEDCVLAESIVKLNR